VHQRPASFSQDQPVTVATSKVATVECGAGDSDQVVGSNPSSQILPVLSAAGSSGDTGKPTAVDSTAVAQTTSSSLPPTLDVGPSGSVSAGLKGDVVQPVAASTCSSASPPNTAASVPTAPVEPSGRTISVTTLPVSVAPPSFGSVCPSSISNGGVFSSSASFAAVGGFTSVFGNVGQPASSSCSGLCTAIQPAVQLGSTTTVAAMPQPQSQPTGSVSSASYVTFGVSASVRPFSASASSSNLSVVTAPAAVPFASVAGIIQPSSAQAASSSFGFTFQAGTTTSTAGSNSLNSTKGQNVSFQFGSFPSLPSTSSITSVTSSSVSSATGFAPSFGKSQQPFQPVFGNTNSQHTVSGFGSFNNTGETSAAVSSGSQQTTIADKHLSTSGAFQTSGNQSTTFGSFAGVPVSAAPFGSSTFQPGSGIFGTSVPNTARQPISATFTGFTGISAGALSTSSSVQSGSSVFGARNAGQYSNNSSNAFSAVSGPAFGSSGSGTFVSGSVPGQPVANAFSGFAAVSASSNPFGGAAPAFSTSSVQPTPSAFGSSSGAVFNGMPAASSAAQPSVPNGLHKSAAGPFAFSGKSNQTASGTASPFVFGQSTSDINGFSMPASVPTFGASTPASPFTFGKPLSHHLGSY